MDSAAEKEGMPAQEEKGEGPDEEERKILGMMFNGRSGQYSPEADDVLLLRKAAKFLVSLSRVRGEWLEWLTGHCTWRYLLRRACFAQFNYLYHFAARSRGKLLQW